ncbi:MAG: type II toxin-antitoxin system RelE/ParE family toxin [Pirellulales bacterium]
MPATRIVLFRDTAGKVPLLEWLDDLPRKARAKCIARIGRLAQLGHELRRPEADLLRDGIYELRVGLSGIHYRMLYFYYARGVAVLSHGLKKRREVPPNEIDLAVRRKDQFQHAPATHTHEEVINE